MKTEKTDKFNKDKNFTKAEQCKCCLNCKHAFRWCFRDRYDQDPRNLNAYCMHPDAPREPIRFGGSVERKVVSPFDVCDGHETL